MKSNNSPTEVILTREVNFGIVAEVSNIKYQKRKKSFSFDTKIVSNPYCRDLIRDSIQEEILHMIVESIH